jgi:hypothetical protein
MDTSTMQRATSAPKPLTKLEPIAKPVTLRVGSFADGQGCPSDRVGRFVDCAPRLA